METLNFADVSEQLHTIGDYVRFGASQFNQAELYFGHGTINAWDEAITLIMHQLSLPSDMVDELMQCRLVAQEKQAILAFFERRITEGLSLIHI